MAVKKACLVTNRIGNTGKECDTAMKATAMLIPMDTTVTADQTDFDNLNDWMDTLIHEKKAFPIFGQKAPIRTITNSADNDVTVTMDDGSIIFVRPGIYNRTFETTSGGLCYANALLGLLESGLGILEIDIVGNALFHYNADKTFSPMFVNNMSAPSPLLADFKNVYRNRFGYLMDPYEMVQNGVIMSGFTPLLSKMGLVNAELSNAGGSSTTKLRINVKTECAETDLIALIGSPLAIPANFIVKNAAGVVQTVASAAIVGGVLELTGTWTSGQAYTVWGNTPITWYNNDVIGYDASESSVVITI